MAELNNSHALRALDLKRILAELPDHWYVQPNNVGSISVWDRHPSEPGAQLMGYVDFRSGAFIGLA